jgi:glycosyltransferase involved in cell wall biosynthesis
MQIWLRRVRDDEGVNNAGSGVDERVSLMPDPNSVALPERPRVSVVMPLYNKVAHVARAVNSVLAQTFTEFEVIVVDDGSTDGSGDVVRQMPDRRIRLIVQENAGEGAARNRGILEARSELTAFIDSDDEWLPCFLETVLTLRAAYPDAGAYATAYQCDDGLCRWRPDFAGCIDSPQGGLLEDYFCAAMRASPVWSSAVMIPKSVLAEIGNFPVGVKRGADLQTWAAIALRYRVAWSPVDGAVYHLAADNRACVVYPLDADASVAKPIEDFLASGREPISSRFYVQEYLAKWRLDVAEEHLRNGRKAWARSLVRKARSSVLSRRRRLLLAIRVGLPLWIARPLQFVVRKVRHHRD